MVKGKTRSEGISYQEISPRFCRDSNPNPCSSILSDALATEPPETAVTFLRGLLLSAMPRVGCYSVKSWSRHQFGDLDRFKSGSSTGQLNALQPELIPSNHFIIYSNLVKSFATYVLPTELTHSHHQKL
ncbi:hypothetical protein RRG08_014600 [Elysia crispata]|uniref:Uncharacterized protein n=1 Tax=Elysia crispata TaxID=231223 RepID=A0AAE0Z2F1_9GAST|nr:hypothetical protein RRG08_014600 [Elysia crispata]